jgi:hypothetical protein
LIAAAALYAGAVFGQVREPGSITSPPRGILPSGTYDSLDDLVTVNTVTGSMSAKFPIYQMPPGHGGYAGFELALHYTSTQHRARDAGPYSYQGQDFRLITLYSEPGGGWRYSFSYSLELEERPGLETIDCNEGVSVSRAQYRYRLTLVLPDGSRHLLRMAGQVDLFGDGYYRYNPAGQGVAVCGIAAPAPLPGKRRYITTDGTFLQVEVDNTGTCCEQLAWELRFPNGDRRLQGGFAPGGESLMLRGANVLYSTWTFYNSNTQKWTIVA